MSGRHVEPEATSTGWYKIVRWGYPYRYTTVATFDGPGCAKSAERNRARLLSDPNSWVPAEAMEWGVDDVVYGEKVVTLPH